MISGYGGLTKPLPGAQINPAHPLSRGLVGCWLFNEGSGSRANDISGNGNHGTLTNMSPNAQNSGWGGSKFGGGLCFDGTGDQVQTTAAVTTRNLSVVGWARLNNPDGVDAALWAALEGTSYRYFLFELEGAEGKIYLYLGDGSTYSPYSSAIMSFDCGWHQVGVTIAGGGGITFYYDGVAVGTANSAQPETAFTLGFTSDDYRRLQGAIDHGSVYNRALSAAEVMQLYNDPFCTLLSPRRWYVAAAGPSGVIMNQFQKCNVGADLFNGSLQ